MAVNVEKELWDSYNGKGFAAEYAGYAKRAGHAEDAESAGYAERASKDEDGNDIVDTYATKAESDSRYVHVADWVSADKEIPDAPSGVVIGGRKYSTIVIGNQEWITENLDYKFGYEGGQLPVGVSGTPTTPAAWYYNNDESAYGVNGNKYGLLYNGYAANYLETNKATLLPEGWHVPTKDELYTLIRNTGGGTTTYANTAALALKSTSGWADKGDGTSGNGTDAYGFTLFGAGSYGSSGFGGLGESCSIWSATKYNSSQNYFMACYNDMDNATASSPKQCTIGSVIRLVRILA